MKPNVNRAVDEELVRIELECIELPHQPSEYERAREEATREARLRTAELLRYLGVGWREEEHDDRVAHRGDAYVYPPINRVEETLDALDANNINFDYVDLPHAASAALEQRLVQRLGRHYVSRGRV